MKWVKKKTGPPAPTVAKAAELDDLKAAGSPVVLGYFSDLKVV